MTVALNLPDKQEWTVDDLATLPEDLRYELIDGRLILPSPTAVHNLLAIELMLALRVGCPPDLVPVTDLSLKVDHRNEPRPDVLVVRRGRHLGVSPLPVENAALVVEVISASSHFRDMYAKTKVYAAAGVGSYWVIDPYFEGGLALIEFRPGGNGEYEQFTTTDKVFTTDVPYPISIDLPALTKFRREMLADDEPSA